MTVNPPAQALVRGESIDEEHAAAGGREIVCGRAARGVRSYNNDVVVRSHDEDKAGGVGTPPAIRRVLRLVLGGGDEAAVVGGVVDDDRVADGRVFGLEDDVAAADDRGDRRLAPAVGGEAERR